MLVCSGKATTAKTSLMPSRRGSAPMPPPAAEVRRWQTVDRGTCETIERLGTTVTKEKNSVLHLGIDLGTSRSSVSASNGERHVVESYIGWPGDMVARKLVKKPVMFGREALE